MNRLLLSDIDIEVFLKSFNEFKKFVKTDFEFDGNNYELTTNCSEFNKWHLVTLAQFYGTDLFLRNNQIEITEFQSTNIKFNVDYNLPLIKLTTQWNEIIHFDSSSLFSADLFLLNKLKTVLSKESELLINKELPNLDFEKTFFLKDKSGVESYIKYAYSIQNSTLILLEVENNTATIVNLFKIKWNEI